MYIDSRKDVLFNFVCDFLQDEYGRFHFLKIHEFNTCQNPIDQQDWKVST